MRNIFKNNYIEPVYVSFFLISFSIIPFWYHGIEKTRYILLFLFAIILYKNSKIISYLIKNTFTYLLLAFSFFVFISLQTNNISLTNLDEVLNWAITFYLTITASIILKDKEKYILYSLIISVFLFFIISNLLFFLNIAEENQNSHIYFQNLFDFNYLHLALVFGATSIINIVFLTQSKSYGLKFFHFLAFLASAFMLIKTTSRGVIGGCALSASIYYFYHAKLNSKHILIFILIAFSFSIILFKTPQGIRTKNEIIQTFTATEKDKSLRMRFFLWYASFKSFLDKPFSGNGFENFRNTYEKQYHIYKNNKKLQKKFPLVKSSDKNAHNFFLHFLLETGIFGTLAITLFFCSIIFYGFNRFSMTSIASALALITSLVHYQVNMDLYSPLPSTLTFTLCGVIAGSHIKKQLQIPQTL
ncbi:O-antigen ligase family protein [Desulfohalobium retbaense]|uniref:O-antigen polymerase n=1 Tax=Desulfohalobium retbaense (strain ATCC 49708 / DSM 5692 / JCM 16813 / HR100) TaxID=485915 RepID=C8WZW4_DESRD|nr:O-antigen ligase family protein [Desulfohalobium retbaense]ACV67589.1 O-antigen polymerase [Desulfohalobium retbaense DSM 5692]